MQYWYFSLSIFNFEIDVVGPNFTDPMRSSILFSVIIGFSSPCSLFLSHLCVALHLHPRPSYNTKPLFFHFVLGIEYLYYIWDSDNSNNVLIVLYSTFQSSSKLIFLEPRGSLALTLIFCDELYWYDLDVCHISSSKSNF